MQSHQNRKSGRCTIFYFTILHTALAKQKKININRKITEMMMIMTRWRWSLSAFLCVVFFCILCCYAVNFCAPIHAVTENTTGQQSTRPWWSWWSSSSSLWWYWSHHHHSIISNIQIISVTSYYPKSAWLTWLDWTTPLFFLWLSLLRNKCRRLSCVSVMLWLVMMSCPCGSKYCCSPLLLLLYCVFVSCPPLTLWSSLAFLVLTFFAICVCFVCTVCNMVFLMMIIMLSYKI